MKRITRVAIIVLNWNQPQLTTKTISSLLRIKTPGFIYHLYLVDNGSTDNSLKIFKRRYRHQTNITVLSTDQNLGYVGGNNYGIIMAKIKKYDYFLILNNDVLVNPDFLHKLISYSKKNRSVGLLAPKIYFAPGFEFHKDRYQKQDLGNVIWFAGGLIDWKNVNCSHRGVDEVDHGQYNLASTQVDYLTGCCLLIKNKVITKVGLFDPKYYLYLEDADYCLRAKEAGFRIAYVPQSKIWHLNSGSSSSGGNLHHYFLTRNRLYFGFKYAPLRTKIALAKDSLRIFSSSLSVWQRRAVRDFYLGNLNKGSWR